MSSVDSGLCAPPYLNATGPLFEDGDPQAGKFDTVAGWTQMIDRGTGTDAPRCPRSKVYVV